MAAGDTCFGNAICIDTLSENLQAYDFSLLQASYWEKASDHAFDEIPTSFKVIVMAEGRYSIQFRGTEYYVGKGDVLLVAPYALFTTQFRKESPCSLYHIYFDVAPAKKHMQFLNLFHCGGLAIFPGLLDDHSIGAIQLVYQNIKKRQPGCYYSGKLMLQHILLNMLQHTARDSRNEVLSTDYSVTEIQIIRRCVEYLNERNGENVRVADLCAYLGVSQGYLFKCFKHTFHMSTKEFLLVYRFRQIETQLAQTNRPIHIIAEQFGYLSLYSFSNAFKRRYGVSPSQYRRNCQQEQKNQ